MTLNNPDFDIHRFLRSAGCIEGHGFAPEGKVYIYDNRSDTLLLIRVNDRKVIVRDGRAAIDKTYWEGEPASKTELITALNQYCHNVPSMTLDELKARLIEGTGDVERSERLANAIHTLWKSKPTKLPRFLALANRVLEDLANVPKDKMAQWLDLEIRTHTIIDTSIADELAIREEEEREDRESGIIWNP